MTAKLRRLNRRNAGTMHGRTFKVGYDVNQWEETMGVERDTIQTVATVLNPTRAILLSITMIFQIVSTGAIVWRLVTAAMLATLPAYMYSQCYCSARC